jgi:hypothetical protein
MNLRGILAWFLVGSVFIDNVYIVNNWGFDFRVQYLAFIIVIPVYLIAFPLKINLRSLLTGFIISLFLFVSPLIAGTPLTGSIRQLLLIFTCAFPFYCMFNSFDFDVFPAFRIYLFFSRAISILAIAQFIFILIGFKPGYDYSYLGFDMSRLEPETLRIQAWMAEPSFLAYILIPSLFYYLASAFNLRERGKKISIAYALIIVIAMALTRSLISYMSITIALTVIFFSAYSVLRKPLAILFSILLIIVFSLFAYQVPPVKMRIDDTLLVLEGQDLESVNLSTFHFFNNLRVVAHSLDVHPFFGTGFGNYYIAYDKYADHSNDDPKIIPDGASLLFRLLTETGLVFTSLYLFWVFRNRIKIKTVSGTDGFLLWVVNNGVFLLIIMRLVRLPHYTALGFPFFILLFCFTCSSARFGRKNESPVLV